MPANLGQNFYSKLVNMTSGLGMKPEDLLAVMVSESGINPSAGNKNGGASGLIQFMPSTLKNVGFKGDPSAFRQMSGEDQLPFIKKYIEGNSGFNGAPFTSAAQYYVANLWPVALRLPGIKNGDPSTAFLENDPAVVKDPRTGQTYSKKYYDIGIKIPAAKEIQAYKANTLFHGSTPGAITYGDMMKQVEKNKNSSQYRNALAQMKAQTGYEAALPDKTQPGLSQPGAPSTSPLDGLNQLLHKYLGMAEANTFLIRVKTGNYSDAVEFARILCSVLDDELKTCSYTCADGSSAVEIECKAKVKTNVENIKMLSNVVAEHFKLATTKLGGIVVETECMANKKSDLQGISIKQAESSHRSFLLKFIGKK